MSRRNEAPLIRPGAAPFPVQQPLGRIPKDFKEAMLHIPVKLAHPKNNSTRDVAAKTKPAPTRAAKPSDDKWRSSFKPLGQPYDYMEKSTDSSPRVEIYDPYDPDVSDSEQGMPDAQNHNESPPNEDYGQRSSPSRSFGKKRCWGSSYTESVNQSLDRSDFEPEIRPAQSQSVSPSHRLPERPGYDSMSRPLDHRFSSPDGLIYAASAQMFPAMYGGQMTNGDERIILPEYEREMNTTVRLSPPRLQQDHQQLKYLRTERDQVSPSTEDSRNWNINIVMDKRPITCDLCDIELANGGELDDHLESKSHWDTLEHIQQQNNYDDLAIAFLQEVLQYKSHQCSRAIEDGALQGK
ncbi:uncharacterized protein LOC119209752 isoform X2 [Pungitius pungitius]|uniref:uncharacterized protein LOC119209752 isoform X2 n=1 Tax=Pungitius pungitius TaxID=134920 RepID=UPI002E115BCA